MPNSRNDELPRFASFFGALSNPHRLAIFARLASCCDPGTVCRGDEAAMRARVGELGADLGIAPSTVSHHLKELRQGGLIRMERRGQTIECWVDPDVVRGLEGFFAQWLPAAAGSPAACCENAEASDD